MDSMTGFFQIVSEKENVLFDIKLSSINSKTLEYKIDGIKDFILLDKLKTILQKEIFRGKIYIQIFLKEIFSDDEKLFFDENKILEIKNKIDSVAKIINIKNDLSISSLLNIYSNNFKNKEIAGNKENIFEKDLIKLFKKAIKGLKKDRHKEGKKLETEFVKYLTSLSENAEELFKMKDKYFLDLREKIKNKYKNFLLEMDEIEKKSLEKEINFLILKGDYEEEIVRIKAHLEKFFEILKDKNIGKRMGFLLQELTREFNTLGDKILDIKGKDLVIESKILIDRMKEQSMNIE